MSKKVSKVIAVLEAAVILASFAFILYLLLAEAFANS
jgi:hypothetical protein